MHFQISKSKRLLATLEHQIKPLHIKKAPEQEIASVTFSGSYEKMPAVTEAAANWLEANAYRLNGPMFNIYHVSPAADPDPEKWLTEACFPITKGAE
nr:GyrI-like domain-containing protein [Listeria floridensis]